MRKITLFVFFVMMLVSMKAQVVITAEDMPDPGDTLRTSVTLDLGGIDYLSTGTGYTWDFSDLTVMSQQIDTFVSVGSTPAVYQLVFNNQFIYPDYKATVARKLREFSSIPGFDVSDTYQYFKEETNEYREVGVGVTLAGIPLPVMYQQIDTIYRFPLAYGNIDSAHSSVSIAVPNMGYLGIQKKRVNTADGWGTLITPYGSFSALRVKTYIEEFDSLYIDSLNTGFPVYRQYTEYKWLANGFSLPLLVINEENNIATATYVDSVRTAFTGIANEEQDLDFNFKVYPNPAKDYLSVSYELVNASAVRISLFSLDGREQKELFNATQARGLYNKLINIGESGIKKGLYLVILEIDKKILVKRVLIG